MKPVRSVGVCEQPLVSECVTYEMSEDEILITCMGIKFMPHLWCDRSVPPKSSQEKPKVHVWPHHAL